MLYCSSNVCSLFCCDYFGDGGVSWIICLGWPWTLVLLISAYQIARITGMSHQSTYLVHLTNIHVVLTICTLALFWSLRIRHWANKDLAFIELTFLVEEIDNKYIPISFVWWEMLLYLLCENRLGWEKGAHEIKIGKVRKFWLLSGQSWWRCGLMWSQWRWEEIEWFWSCNW
jgi:hypothetical protein